jgi:hypothetical protein
VAGRARNAFWPAGVSRRRARARATHQQQHGAKAEQEGELCEARVALEVAALEVVERAGEDEHLDDEGEGELAKEEEVGEEAPNLKVFEDEL